MTTSHRRKRLNINSASAAELARLPGINSTLARRIIARRPFKKAKELLHVRGVDPAIYELASRRLRVGAVGEAPPPKESPERKPARKPAAKRAVVARRLPVNGKSARKKIAPAAPPPASPVKQPDGPGWLDANAEPPVPHPIPVGPPPLRVERWGAASTLARAAAGPGAATHTARRAAPAIQETALEEAVYEPEIVLVVPPTVSFVTAETEIVPAQSRAIALRPSPPGDLLADRRTRPWAFFVVVSTVLAALFLGLAAGAFIFGNRPPQTSATATLLPVAIQFTAAPEVPAIVPPTLPATPAPAPPSPAPTLFFAPNSGLAGAGAQIFNETFAAPGYWDLGENDFSNIFIASERLTLQMKFPDAIAWTLNGYAGGDFFYQADAYVGLCQAGDYYGLVFRSRNDNSRYLLGLSCDGQYRVIHQQGNQFQDLVGFTFTPLAIPGSNSANLLAVRAVGSQLSFYINDNFLTTIDDASPEPGLFGVFVRSASTPNLQVDFDDLSAWEIKP